MPGGNAVKIGIVVVALGVAVAVFAFTRSAPGPKITSDVKELICTKCQNHTSMPLKDWEAAMAKLPARVDPNAGGKPGPRVVPVQLPKLMKCDKCGEDAVLLAAKCLNSDTWYPIVNVDGSRGECPTK